MTTQESSEQKSRLFIRTALVLGVIALTLYGLLAFVSHNKVAEGVEITGNGLSLKPGYGIAFDPGETFTILKPGRASFKPIVAGVLTCGCGELLGEGCTFSVPGLSQQERRCGAKGGRVVGCHPGNSDLRFYCVQESEYERSCREGCQVRVTVPPTTTYRHISW